MSPMETVKDAVSRVKHPGWKVLLGVLIILGVAIGNFVIGFGEAVTFAELGTPFNLARLVVVIGTVLGPWSMKPPVKD